METKSFETELKELNNINDKLENGNVGLQDSLKLYKKGKICSNTINKILSNTKTSFAKIEADDGTEKPYSRDKNGKDINNNASVAPTTSIKSSKSSSSSISNNKSPKSVSSKSNKVSNLSLFSHTNTSNSIDSTKQSSNSSSLDSSSDELSDDDLPF